MSPPPERERRLLRSVPRAASVADDSPTANELPVDALLMEQVARGSREAYAELYDLISPRVWGTVLAVVRNRAIAEEVSQEVLVEIWRRAPRFDRSRGSVMAWVTTIAHRRAVDRVRSEQSARDRDERSARDVPTSSAPADHDLDERSTRELASHRVHRALDGLTDLQRESLELAYFGGNTYREVAVLLGVPEGTVKTRIRDGLIRLRHELDAS